MSDHITAYYGSGRGKTSAALGYGILVASRGERVIMIQFLKSRDDNELDFVRRLEPEIRFFRFQKSEKFYDELTPEEKQEERMNMQNGLHYARKVLQTGECDLLILDEVLGLVSEGVIPEQELIELLRCGTDQTQRILTGQSITDGVLEMADNAFEIVRAK